MPGNKFTHYYNVEEQKTKISENESRNGNII